MTPIQATEIITKTLAAAGMPLTEDQSLLLTGAVAVCLGKAVSAAQQTVLKPAPARVAFSQAQMRRLYDNSPEFHCDVTSRYSFYRIVMLAERAHEIRPEEAQQEPAQGKEA